MDKTQELRLLLEELEYHDKKYFQEDDPEITDAEYDALVRNYYTKLKEAGTTDKRKVGFSPDKIFDKVKHEIPMLSIKNAFRSEDVLSWLKDITSKLGKTPDIICDLKYDGLAASIVYVEGVLTTVSTRGDGYVGEDITHRATGVKNIPRSLRKGHPKLIEIRGEIVLLKKAVSILNKQRVAEGKKPFANTRNAAAGLMRRKDIGYVNGLVFLPYGIGKHSDDFRFPDSHAVAMKKAVDLLGIVENYSPPRIVTNEDLTYVHSSAMVERNHLDYDIDGIVLRVNSRADMEKLGSRSREPIGIIAHKFPEELIITTLEGILNQVGRTGVITPVAVITPTEIAGVIVERATLHNYKEVHRKKIMVGKKVILKRAGEVIPEIVASAGKIKNYVECPIPDSCPSCGDALDDRGSDTNLYCINPNCEDVLLQQLIFYVSKKVLDVNGLGESLVNELFDRGHLRHKLDIFNLNKKQLLECSKVADRKASNILKAIENSKTVDYWRFIRLIDIPNVGESLSKDLAKRFPSVSDLINVKEEDLINIPDIGPKTIKSILDKFHDVTVRREIAEMQKVLSIWAVEGSSTAEKFIVSITGTLDVTRSEFSHKLSKVGGVLKPISKKTDYAIIGINPSKAKVNKIKTLSLCTIRGNKAESIIKYILLCNSQSDKNPGISLVVSVTGSR